MIFTIDNLFNELAPLRNEKFSWDSTLPNNQGNYSITTLEDGKQELIVSVVGHNPKNVDVDVTEGIITIKALNWTPLSLQTRFSINFTQLG